MVFVKNEVYSGRFPCHSEISTPRCSMGTEVINSQSLAQMLEPPGDIVHSASVASGCQ
jgi:hypothetical protein